MSDDRYPAGATGPGGEVDDDALADAIAAELERYTTGAVPVIRVPVAGPAAPDPAAPRRRPETAPEIAAPAFGRPEPRPQPASGEQPAGVRPAGWTISTDELPVVRRSGYREPVRPARPAAAEAVPPIERVLPTGPIVLPEPTASLLDEMLDGGSGPRSARHAAPVPIDGPTPELEDRLRITGPLPLPPALYEDWEQSLRAIGRPRDPDDEDEEAVPGASIDTATVAYRLPVTGPAAALRPPVAEPVPAPATGPRPALRPAAEPPVEEASIDTAPTSLTRGRARLGAAPEEVAVPPVADREADEEGIDDPAAPEAPTPQPAGRPPRTAPVFVERVRTAILELRAVPAGPTGGRPEGSVARWLGAFASPVVLLAGAAAGGVAAGPVAAAAVLLGVLLAVPAIARTASWAVDGRADGDVLERAVLGRRVGTVAAAALVLVRLVAAALALVGIGALAAAFEAKTGAIGSSATGVQVIAVAGVGALALAAGTWSARLTGALLLVLAAVGTVVTVFLLAVLLPAAGAAAGTSAAGLPAAVGVGFAAVGLLLVLAGPDLARLRTAIPRPGAAAIAGAVSALLGALVLVAGLAVGAGTRGAPDAALAGALGDATASLLAAPLAVGLLLGSLTLPAVLMRSAGAGAARLVGDGRSVRLGTLSAGLLAIAAALGVVASGLDVTAAALTAAALAGVPAAAWAGALTTARTSGARVAVVAATVSTATLIGWVLADGLLPGWTSPVLDAAALPAASGWRGGPVVGLLAAFALSALGGLMARGREARAAAPRDPVDSVEG